MVVQTNRDIRIYDGKVLFPQPEPGAQVPWTPTVVETSVPIPPPRPIMSTNFTQGLQRQIHEILTPHPAELPPPAQADSVEYEEDDTRSMESVQVSAPLSVDEEFVAPGSDEEAEEYFSGQPDADGFVHPNSQDTHTSPTNVEAVDPIRPAVPRADTSQVVPPSGFFDGLHRRPTGVAINIGRTATPRISTGMSPRTDPQMPSVEPRLPTQSEHYPPPPPQPAAGQGGQYYPQTQGPVPQPGPDKRGFMRGRNIMGRQRPGKKKG
jgi:hypothetical protein